ncbi:MAG: stage II sporulation protein M [Candidatus Aenigmatarchaeota archaeon]
MLERIVSIKEAVRNPYWLFVIGGVVSVICLFVSLTVFESSIGLFFSFLVTMTMMPFMINLMRYEEARQEELIKKGKELSVLERNKNILKVYVSFFCGMILSLSIIYLMLPERIVEKAFQDQINEINAIRARVVFADTFTRIIVNNVGVLSLSFLFSVLFGAGAIFILTWNASVLSAAIGMVAKSVGGMKGLPIAILTFFPHGSLEILAYFIGGISGGIVSAALTRRKTEGLYLILKDSFSLLIISLLLLVVAALIESIQIVI